MKERRDGRDRRGIEFGALDEILDTPLLRSDFVHELRVSVSVRVKELKIESR